MYSIKERVRYSEVDQNKYLTLTGIINYFQDCSTFQSEDIGLGLDVLESHKKGWILSSWQIIVERQPQFGEEIEVSTWPTGFNSMYGTRNFTMKDRDGNMLAYANSIWVFMDAVAGRPAKPSEEDIKGYDPEPELDMDYAPRKIALPKEWENGETFPVMKSQIDTNHHVNNGQYIQMALEALPEALSVRQVRAEYRKSAVYGDVILPRINRSENKTVVELCDTNEKPYAVIEFIGEK